MMSSAVQAALFEEVDKVDEELSADAASETRRVPAGIWAGSGGEHTNVPNGHALLALQQNYNEMFIKSRV